MDSENGGGMRVGEGWVEIRMDVCVCVGGGARGIIQR